MPVVNSRVAQGPFIQADQSCRGSLEYTLDDGRKRNINVRAKDLSAWNNLLNSLIVRVEEGFKEQDSEEAIRLGRTIKEFKQASLKRVLLNYLITAFETGDPYQSYLLFLKIKQHLDAERITFDQAANSLLSEGLSIEEASNIKIRFQFLSKPDRADDMEAWQNILDADILGKEFR